MQVLLQLASVTADIFSDEQYTAYVMCRTKAAADDFARGLNSIFGLFDIIKGNAHAFKPLFIYSGTSLSLSTSRHLFCWTFSEAGSNSYTKEQETAYAWEVMLQAIDGKLLLLGVCLSVCLSVFFSVCLLAGLLDSLHTNFGDIWWQGGAWSPLEMIKFWGV